MRAPLKDQLHRQRVERESFADCDGLYWSGSERWPDGHLLNRMFWDYYAPNIDDRNHGRALRALIRATPHGMKAFSNATEFRAMLVATMGPFWKKQPRPGRDECAYCGRPDTAPKTQCAGCGAWRKA